jgi:hypothetical protein
MRDRSVPNNLLADFTALAQAVVAVRGAIAVLCNGAEAHDALGCAIAALRQRLFGAAYTLAGTRGEQTVSNNANVRDHTPKNPTFPMRLIVECLRDLPTCIGIVADAHPRLEDELIDPIDSLAERLAEIEKALALAEAPSGA